MMIEETITKFNCKIEEDCFPIPPFSDYSFSWWNFWQSQLSSFDSGAGRGRPIWEQMLDQHSPSELALPVQIESGLLDS